VPVALVVDDDADIRSVIVYMLERVGFEVHIESDGETGFKTAVAVKPDVVLLDWMMPRMSGVEVCRALRSQPDLTSVAIILLTAKAQESDVRLGFEAGADDYIVKPFRPREFIDRVQSILGRDALVEPVGGAMPHRGEGTLMRDGRQVETDSPKHGGLST
jgi:DNA-binding response OmpR family regulator